MEPRSLTVGNAVLSVPFSLPRGEGGPPLAAVDEGLSGNPKGNLHFGKEAKSPTVGNAVLSVPKNKATRRVSLPRGEGGTAQAVTDEG